MADDFTYNLSSNLGLVRLEIQDNNSDEWIFSDAEINAFLAMYSDDVDWAAARALDVIASNKALISKRIRLLDLTLEGATIANELRIHADRLRNNSAAFDSFNLPRSIKEDLP